METYLGGILVILEETIEWPFFHYAGQHGTADQCLHSRTSTV